MSFSLTIKGSATNPADTSFTSRAVKTGLLTSGQGKRSNGLVPVYIPIEYSPILFTNGIRRFAPTYQAARMQQAIAMQVITTAAMRLIFFLSGHFVLVFTDSVPVGGADFSFFQILKGKSRVLYSTQLHHN